MEDDATSSNRGDDNDTDGELFNACKIQDSVLIIQCQMRKSLATIKFNAYTEGERERERAIQNAARIIQCQIRRFLVTIKGILFKDNYENHRENGAV